MTTDHTVINDWIRSEMQTVRGWFLPDQPELRKVVRRIVQEDGMLNDDAVVEAVHGMLDRDEAYRDEGGMFRLRAVTVDRSADPPR